MRLPRAVRDLIEQLEKLPGIGPKSAQRLAFYLLHNPQAELDKYAAAFTNLKQGTKVCGVCKIVGEVDPCEVCTDGSRDRSVICVVEQPLDVLAIERSGAYEGLYHVLHGAIAPLNNIGPEQLFIFDLLPRLENGTIAEIILATNPTMEGEATAMYIKEEVLRLGNKSGMKITRLARGLPSGADLEYADKTTIKRAYEGRAVF